MAVNISLSIVAMGIREMNREVMSETFRISSSADAMKARVPHMCAAIVEEKLLSAMQTVSFPLLLPLKKSTSLPLKTRTMVRAIQCKKGKYGTALPTDVKYQKLIKTAKIKAETCHPRTRLKQGFVSAPATKAETGIVGKVSQAKRLAPVKARLIDAPIKAARAPSQGPKIKPKTGAMPETIPILTFSAPMTGKPGK